MVPAFVMPQEARRSLFSAMLIAGPHRRRPDKVILTRDGKPYMRRWHITPRGDVAATYLHHFEGSDDDRALHDHPWWSIGTLLQGSYLEHRRGHEEPILRPEGSVIVRSPEDAHRIELIPDQHGALQQVWTLFQVGPRVREWGFYCPEGWKHWREFTAPGTDGRSRGCE